MGLKIAISGKGGVGKTTLTSLLAYHFAQQGPVLAIDADPSPCLGQALGFSDEELIDIQPIAAMSDLIAERTGSDPRNGGGGVFKLNPRVDDLPERCALHRNNLHLLLLGAVQEGGAGCICPQSALLKQLLRHVLLARNEVVLLDLYAGVEHLGRATAEAVDVMVMVAEPTRRSIRTVRQIAALAADVGIERLALVGNKVERPEDRTFFQEAAAGLPIAGMLPVTGHALRADRSGTPLYHLAENLHPEVTSIAQFLAQLNSGTDTPSNQEPSHV